MFHSGQIKAGKPHKRPFLSNRDEYKIAGSNPGHVGRKDIFSIPGSPGYSLIEYRRKNNSMDPSHADLSGGVEFKSKDVSESISEY